MKTTHKLLLTDRELKIIRAVIKCGSSKATATHLNIEPKSVENTLKRVRIKLGTKNTLSAAIIFNRYYRQHQ